MPASEPASHEIPAQVRNDEDQMTATTLLHHLRSTKEFELYYYLFNEVEIRIAGDNKLEISRDGADKTLNNRLTEVLFAWTDSKWNVIIASDLDGLSLKDKMKKRFAGSKEWSMLQDNFSGVVLTDIILE